MKTLQLTHINEAESIESLIPDIRGLIESYGGTSSLANPFIIVRIQEELQKFHPNITDAQMTEVVQYLNVKK